MRREADAVLGEVTRKQTEAKRQVGLLDALIKLRQLRAQRAAMDLYNKDMTTDHFAKKFAIVIGKFILSFFFSLVTAPSNSFDL